LNSQFVNPPEGTINANRVVAIAASAEKMIGPVSQPGFNDADGIVHVAYSAVTSVTVAVIKVR
jgi:hypothetical protein